MPGFTTVYVKGQWNVLCDRCGISYANIYTIKESATNLVVCLECYDERQDQMKIKRKADAPRNPKDARVLISGTPYVAGTTPDPNIYDPDDPQFSTRL